MKKNSAQLPPIPDKRYFSISETSKLCQVKPHVLRYWEQEFSQLKPCKRTGGRRYYQDKDIVMIRHIRELLYDKGFTISGAKQQLHSFTPVVNEEKTNVPSVKMDANSLSSIIDSLKELVMTLKSQDA